MPSEEQKLIHLNDTEFHQYFAPPMNEVTSTAAQYVDIWPYVEKVFDLEYAHLQTDSFDVKWVYETGDKRYQHVLIPLSDDDAPLVIVIDTKFREIAGHRLLNLKQKYGLAH